MSTIFQNLSFIGLNQGAIRKNLSLLEPG